MSSGKVTKEKEPINSIDYIKDSIIFTNPRYEWIIPLITKTLEDDLCDSNINDLVDSFLSKKKTKSDQASSSQSAPQVIIDNEDEDSNVSIKKIKSVDEISNIGLLEVKEPIELKDGLNVFYGKNGAGKSSIYLGLCKVLGKNKRIYSNIATESDESRCQITFEGNNGDDYTLEWDSSDEKEESKVMVFDSLISNYIVDQDQENQFKMAHLKMEYFSFLYDLYQKVSNTINIELGKLDTQYDALGQILTEKIPSVFENDFDWDEKKIIKYDFSKKSEEKLADLNRQIKVLERDNPDSIVKNIENALEVTENILSVFGESDEEENEDSETEYIWELYYDKLFIEDINKKIEKYNKVKKAFEKSGKNKISSLIPPEWINNNIWEAFISSSIDFLNSLDEEESKKYINESCAYCHQPLQTKEAKALVKAYQELHEEYKEKLDEETDNLKEMSELMDECIKAIKGISTKNRKIEKEFSAIGKKDQINFDFESVKNIFQKYKTAIAKVQNIPIDDTDIKAIKNFWSIYESLYSNFKTAINKINKDIASKDTKIKKYEAEIEPILEKKALYENKDNIIKYLKLYELKEVLKNKISDITPLRQATSVLKSSFSNEATLKEFKICLQDEYDCFDYSPPEMWSIAPATRSGVNKRVYSIGDKRLAEIFSEGEKKIHALSDFFAQCELNKYRGIYIFDDPVNSLDEDNIEVVANRIIRLVEDGNQVIVFTHNLYFLNSIINTQKEKITKVERTNNQINLLKEIRIGETQELKDRLNKINSRMSELSKKKPEEIDEYDLRNIYDLISGYLEDYVEKVYFKNIISRYRPNIRMQTLGDLKDLDTSIMDKVLKFHERTSRRGSRHSQPGEVKKPNYPELSQDVKDLKDNYKLS